MKHGQKTFTLEQADAIRTECAAGQATRSALANRFAVGKSTIDRIITGKTYQPRPGPKPRLKHYRLSGAPRVSRTRHNTRTRTLLRKLGIPADVLAPPAAHFWTYHAMTLDFLARLARRTFLARIKNLHPDNNGDNAEAAALNQLWQTLRTRFRRHGVNP